MPYSWSMNPESTNLVCFKAIASLHAATVPLTTSIIAPDGLLETFKYFQEISKSFKNCEVGQSEPLDI